MLPLLLILLYLRYILIYLFFLSSNNSKVVNKVDNFLKKDDLILIDKDNKNFKLDKEFLEWFVGFTDAEGNFSITLRDKPAKKPNNLLDSLKNKKSQENTVPKYVNLTFQIGLHINDLNTLIYIKEKLKTGNISISKERCNYYVSDFKSIIHIIIPIFNFFLLNSSKYSQFLTFKQAATIIYDKTHLINVGFSKLLYLRNNIYENPNSPNLIRITDNWLLGFIEGDATFSTLKLRPRLKFECHVKEERLFLSIRDYLDVGKVVKTVRYRKKSNKSEYSVILDIWDIYFLKLILVPLLISLDFHTNKYLDFCNWCYITNLYYWGYHLISEGKELIIEIKSYMNKSRLVNFNKKINYDEVKLKVTNLFNVPSPYVIKNTKRVKRFDGKMLNLEVIVLNTIDNNEFRYHSINEAACALRISRKKIRSLLGTGIVYKNYIFNESH